MCLVVEYIYCQKLSFDTFIHLVLDVYEMFLWVSLNSTKILFWAQVQTFYNTAHTVGQLKVGSQLTWAFRRQQIFSWMTMPRGGECRHTFSHLSLPMLGRPLTSSLQTLPHQGWHAFTEGMFTSLTEFTIMDFVLGEKKNLFFSLNQFYCLQHHSVLRAISPLTFTLL